MATQRTFSEFMSICEAVSQSDVKLARSGVLSRHADALQREIDDVTSGRKPTTPKVKRKVAKISFIDRSNAKLREESEIKDRQEAIDYVGMSSGAEAATKRAKEAKKARLERQQSEAQAARREFRTKGVPFSDAKGSGHIVNGKKVYDS